MTNIQKTEYLLLINRRLAALDLPVLAGMGCSVTSGAYLTLNHLTRERATNRTTFPEWKDPIDVIIQQARKLAEPTFTPVKKICFNMLEEEFYLDKETKVTVESINTRGAILSNGEVVDHTRLYIMEP